jgi:predicted nucleotidyltransferase
VSELVEPVFDAAAILLELADHGVEFTVVGGVAVQTHGHVRGTHDLDLVPAPDLLNLTRLAGALAALSARVRRADRPVDVGDPHLLRRAPLVPLVTEYGRLDLLNFDLVEGMPKSYEDLRGRAVEVDLEGRIVAVAGLDDLIRMKRVAGREVDLSDVGALTRTDEQLRDEAGEST